MPLNVKVVPNERQRPKRKKDPLSMAGAVLAACAAVLFRWVLLPVGLSTVLGWVALGALFIVAGVLGYRALVGPLLGVWALLAASMVVNPINIVFAALALIAGTIAYGLESELDNWPGLRGYVKALQYRRAMESFRDGWQMLASPTEGLPDSIIVEVWNEGSKPVKV